MRSRYFSESDIVFYETNGYLVLDPSFPEELIGRAGQDISELLLLKRERLAPNDSRRRETESDLHLKSPAVRELITSDVFADLCRRLLGQDVDLRFTMTLTKTKEHGGPVDWHQDWGLGQDQGYPLLSFWIAITDADIGNGCLRIVPGSHRHGLLPHGISKKSPPDIGIEDAKVEGAVPLEMKAGEVLLLHPQVIHGSDSCVSENPRVAVLGGYQIPKQAYTEFWAKSGAQFLRGGVKSWAPLADSGAAPGLTSP